MRLISSLFLLVTTDILTSPVLPKHTEIYSSMGNCFSVIQPGRQWILCPAFLLRQHDKGLIPTAGLVVYMHVCMCVTGYILVYICLCFSVCADVYYLFFFFFWTVCRCFSGVGAGVWNYTSTCPSHTAPPLLNRV